MTQAVTEQQVREWLTAAEEAARRAASILEDWRARFSVREKSRADLVTDADFAAQKAVHTHLTSLFPSHGFVGEEEAPGISKARPDLDAPPTWIVDPLDGTANYVHDVPCYCV
ncbi:MAG: inositol monophosphatase, partial [Planctomycetes bacterium]|nr:inositol monophosphatase [Planctomycetota bacterium]